jgi:hypothetical protein
MTPGTKMYALADAPVELLKLTSRIMPLLLAGEHPTSAILRAQYMRSEVKEVELDKVGFFVHFAVPPDVSRAIPPTMAGGQVMIEVESVEGGAGCVLFVNDGVISTLEGYTYGATWPEHPVVLGLLNAVPLLPAPW